MKTSNAATEAQPSAVRERPILFSAPMVRAILEGRKTQTRRVVKPQPHHGPVGEMVCLGGADWAMDDGDLSGQFRCPYGVPGDRLWVREAWAPNEGSAGGYIYRADVGEGSSGFYQADLKIGEWTHIAPRWRSSIHMPRWASRITLRITDVRVERLQDISEADAIAEGLYKSFPDEDDREWFRDWTEERTGEPPSPDEWADFEVGVWMVPGVPQGWGLTKAERRRDQWAPTPVFAYRQLWNHINGPGSWDANPWVWVVTFERETGSTS